LPTSSPCEESADAIGAQDAILPHNFSQLLVTGELSD
jgi:hypothetical protein